MKPIVKLAVALGLLLQTSQIALAEEGQRGMDLDAARACIQKVLPASSYVTNDLIPTADNLVPSAPLAKPVKLRVGLSWLMNEEQAPFYNAVELGYYKAEGLDVELVAGGPGKNHTQTLAGGVVDIALEASGHTISQGLASPTPLTGVKVVGTLLKGSPAVLITIDPKLQDKKLTPQDLKGSIIAGGSFLRYLPIMLDKAGMAPDSVEILKASPTPDLLYAGAANFYLDWIFNQPRDIEARGIKWNGLMWRDWAFDTYSDVIVMRDDMLNTPDGLDVAKRFMRATYRGLQYLLDQPEKSADIAIKYSVDSPNLTKEKAMFRFTRQESLIRGNPGERLMTTDPKVWDETNALFLQYGYMPNLKCS